MGDKQDSIMVGGVEWKRGDSVMDSKGFTLEVMGFEDNYYCLLTQDGGETFFRFPANYLVNVTAEQREAEKKAAPTIGGIELKPWMRVEIKRGEKYVVCFGMDSERYPDEGVFLVNEGGFLKVGNTAENNHWGVVAVYAAPDYPTLMAKAHGPLLWSKADDEAKKEAEAKKKEAMTALEAAEVEFEAAKGRYTEAYAKLVAITD